MDIFDFHSDVLVDVTRRRRLGERRVLADRHLPRWRAGKVQGACFIIGGDAPSSNPLGVHRPLESTLHSLDALLAELAEAAEQFTLVTDVASLRKARASGRFGVLLGLEGAGPLGADLGVLRSLYRLGLRHVGLSWNGRNAAADGASESMTGGGLTRFGRELVAEAMRLGMMVDVSHLSEAGFWDVMKEATRPVVATHVGAKALRQHVRNLSDDQIRALAERGGLIGLALYPGFLAETGATLEHALHHLDHLLRIAGEEHVALGPDFIDYAPEIIALDLGSVPGLYSGDHSYPKGLEETTQLQHLVDGLRLRGYGTETIEKVCWENAVRVLGATVG